MTETFDTADCERCASLCCMALAFDKSDDFGADKPAGIACENLKPDGKCSIYSELSDKGYQGCKTFDCEGAGTRVTVEVFGGQSWQSDPALTIRMVDAFHVMRQIYRYQTLFTAARALPLSEPDSHTVDDLSEQLSPEFGWTEDSLDTLEKSETFAQADAFIASLKVYIKTPT